MRKLLALAALCAALAACGRRARVRAGDEVLIRYELSAGGSVVESTLDGEPVRIVAGAGDVPPGVDAALLGMAPGEEKTLELPPSAAFGPRDPALVATMRAADFGPLAARLAPGRTVMGARDGKAQRARVLSVSGGAVVLDFNHPLAGRTVVYRVRVVSARP